MDSVNRPQRSLMPSYMPEINRRFLNPTLRRAAAYLPPFAVVVHHGRRSGRIYRTPVLAVRSGSSFAILLAYGNRTDWVRNVTAAKGGELIRGGRLITLTDPRIVADGERDRIPRLLRPLARRVDVLLVEADPGRDGA